MLILGSPFQFAASTLVFDQITALGLTSGLQICLDASDAASYDGSSQTWVDRSGNAYSFYRGTGSGSDAADPTFNGSSGGGSSAEYFSFDGADLFTLNQANPTWVNDVHKNSGQVTVCAWVWINSTTGNNGIIGTYADSPGPAWDLFVQSDNKLVFQVWGTAAQQVQILTTATVSEDQWVFVAVSYNEATGSHFFRINSTNENKSGTAASPAATNTSVTLRVACGGDPADGGVEIESGGRMNSIEVWNRALSGTEVTDFFEATRARFGV